MVLAAKVSGVSLQVLFSCGEYLHATLAVLLKPSFQSEDGKVELVDPPSGSKVGERVFIEGLEGEPASSAQVKKKKIWDTVSKNLKTGEGGVATWNGKVVRTSAGPCSAESLVGVPIS